MFDEIQKWLDFVVKAQETLGDLWFGVWVASFVLLVLAGLVFGWLTFVLTKNTHPETTVIAQLPPQIKIAIYQRPIQTPDDVNIKGSIATVIQPTTDLGRRTETEIYMLWQNASWKERAATMTSEKGFVQFLSSDLMSAAMQNSEFIGCLGLASNSMSPELANSSEDKREKILGDLSDRRAFELCKYVAKAAREVEARSRFVGLGLGYNTRTPDDSSDEVKQRKAILVMVNRKSGPALTKNDVQEIISEILRQVGIDDFKPQEYSRVNRERAICWVSMEQGTFNPNAEDCEQTDLNWTQSENN